MAYVYTGDLQRGSFFRHLFPECFNDHPRVTMLQVVAMSN